MPDLLVIDKLTAGYGEAVVLNEVSLALAEGQALALLGRNGMGKTTLINSIVGVTRYHRRQASRSRATTSAVCVPISAPTPASAGCRRSATSSSRSPSKRT